MPSAQNPADIVSRGCNVEEIKTTIWFKGPEFIRKREDNWPRNSNFDLCNELLDLEKKKPVETVLIVEKLCEIQLLKLFNEKSASKKIIRVVAYILRFVRNCKVKNGHAKELNGEIRALDANEFEASFLKIVEIIQSEEFAGEITELEKGKVLKNNRIQKLNPFIQKITFNDFNLQLLRVG